MKTPIEILQTECNFPDLFWQHDMDRDAIRAIESYHKQFEVETCKWKKVGNVAGICNKMDEGCHNPHIIFVDDLKKLRI